MALEDALVAATAAMERLTKALAPLAAAADDGDDEKPKPASNKGKLTFDQVKARFASYLKADGDKDLAKVRGPKFKAILKKFGADDLPGIDEDKWVAALKELKKVEDAEGSDDDNGGGSDELAGLLG